MSRYSFKAGRVVISTLLALAATQVWGQQSSPQARVPTEATAADETVIVRGQRLSEIEFDLPRFVIEFIEEATAQSRGRGFARWHRHFCVGVLNLEDGPAQYIIDRVSAVAADVGLEPGDPGCNPDSIIIFSTNAQQMASTMVENEPRVFRPVGPEAGTELGFEGLDYFVANDNAVRWWHVSLPVSARTRHAAIETPHTPWFKGPPECYPYVTVMGPSRIHSGIVDELQWVVIIVDGTKLADVSWRQLADYLALVSLAQINPMGEPESFNSILNLFANPAAYSGLTDWDQSYLRSLYAFDQRRNILLQRNQIVSLIVKQEESLRDDSSRD